MSSHFFILREPNFSAQVAERNYLQHGERLSGFFRQLYPAERLVQPFQSSDPQTWKDLRSHQQTLQLHLSLAMSSWKVLKSLIVHDCFVLIILRMHNSGCARDGREMCALSSWSSICGAGAFVRCTSCMLASAQSKSAQLSVFGRVWCLWIGWTKLDIFCVLNLKKWYRTPLEIDLRSQDRTRVCIPCDAGHYQPLPGESTCLLCEPGTRPEFQNAPNMCFENLWT